VQDAESASGTRLHASVLARAFQPLDGALDLAVLGGVGVRSGAQRDDALELPERETLGFHLSAGAGPALRLGRASVAGYALVRMELERDDPDADRDGDHSSRHTLALPAVQLAAEVPIGSWFVVRSGAQYAFEVRGESAPEDRGSSERDDRFGWNLGFGLRASDFAFDASLQHGFLTEGPSFIGGGEPGFLAIASVSYDFDRARKAASVAAVEAKAAKTKIEQAGGERGETSSAGAGAGAGASSAPAEPAAGTAVGADQLPAQAPPGPPPPAAEPVPPPAPSGTP
jgi:hypothetical protein